MLDIDRALSLASDKEIFPIIDKVLQGERLPLKMGLNSLKRMIS